MGKYIGEKGDVQVGNGDRNLRGKDETSQDLLEISCSEIENTKEIQRVKFYEELQSSGPVKAEGYLYNTSLKCQEFIATAVLMVLLKIYIKRLFPN